MTDISETSYQNAQIIRSLIEHENELQNHRLTWLMTIQGLLFAALGFAWDKQDAHALVIIFSILGIVVSLSSWSSLQLNHTAYEELHNWWEKHKPKDYDGPPIVGHRASYNFMLWILRPWRILPWTFILGWLTVVVFNLRRP